MTDAEKPAISILLVEDNPGDARLVEILLRDQSPQPFTVTWVPSMMEALTVLGSHSSNGDGGFHAALLDLSLPDSQGGETISRLRAMSPLLPIVVLTGNDDDSVVTSALQNGAQDFLVKGEISGEMIRRAVRYAIERTNADASLRRSEARFRAVFDNAGLGIALIDSGFRFFSPNAMICSFLEQEAVMLTGMRLGDFLEPADSDGILFLISELLSDAIDGFTKEARFRLRLSGECRWGRINGSLVRRADGRPQYCVLLVEDVTVRKTMEEQLRLAARVVESTGEGVLITDAQRRIIHTNPAFTQLTGYSSDEAIGQRPSFLSSGRHDQNFYAEIDQSLDREGAWTGELWNRRKNGEIFAERINISSVRDDQGRVCNYVAVFNDITASKENEERLTYQAHHDALTGLPNRVLFEQRLEHALRRAQRNARTIAVLFLDLDHFKPINDTLGHLAGDALLQQVAERLQDCVRSADTVARLGGDEFTMIVEDVADYRDAALVAAKVLRQFVAPFQLNGQLRRIGASIGICLVPEDGTSVADILHNADMAMYAAKQQGRNQIRFVNPRLAQIYQERQQMEQALRHALDHGGLELHYQPVTRLADGRITAVETLLRWHHPDGRLLGPDYFMDLARDTGLILPLGRWVMRAALAQIAAWKAAGHTELRVSINLFDVELHQPNLVTTIRELLDEAGVPPSVLDIELPEQLVMESSAETVQAIRNLREMGIRIVLDDFGSGKTCFSVLGQASFDVLKVTPESRTSRTKPGASPAPVPMLLGGAAPVAEAPTDHRVSTAHALGRSLRLSVIAKSVETEDQWQTAQSLQCDGVQGFYHCRPLPAPAMTDMLRDNKARTT